MGTGGRALVLGGGGSTGNAWLIGVVAGLAEAGLDVSAADRIIGTSAGSTAGAQITGARPAELFAATVAAAPAPARRPGAAPAGARAAAGPVIDHLARTDAIIAASADAADMRRRMGAGALALEATADEERQARWGQTVASRLPRPDWPERDLRITAVDARTGDGVVFDRDSGVALADAVAASCASGFAYRIGDGHYIDGGYRRNENADLAAGCERVLVLSPFSGQTRHPLTWGMQLAAQLDELRAGGARVEAVYPEPDAEHLFGANAMDFSLRPAAAQAGHRHGAALAERLAALWR
jgi:NTE family protein